MPERSSPPEANHLEEIAAQRLKRYSHDSTGIIKDQRASRGVVKLNVCPSCDAPLPQQDEHPRQNSSTGTLPEARQSGWRDKVSRARQRMTSLRHGSFLSKIYLQMG